MQDEPRCEAALTALAATSADAERYEASIAGGGKAVRRQAVRREHVAIRSLPEDMIQVVCDPIRYHGDVEHIEDHPRAVFVEFVPQAVGLPSDWRGWADLRLDVSNEGPALRVELTVTGARSRLLTQSDLAPGKTATLRVDLRDLALAAGIKPLYEPQAVSVSFTTGSEGGAPGVCRLLRLALTGRLAPAPVMDRWGQRINADWPGKVRSDEDLRGAREEEERTLAAMEPVANRGRYGGWTSGLRFAASGFFRVERDPAGRWWYADPDGFPFWSTGPTGVRLGDATITAGREEIFAELPSVFPDDARDEAGRLRFYGLNAIRKYGSVAAWVARMRLRLRHWGPNTVANWSDPRVGGESVAYVKSLSSRLLPGPGLFGQMPDVFNPAWEPALRAHFLAEAAPLANDPWLIGYFVDNEMGWGSVPSEKVEAYAERYFGTIRQLLKEADPHHLYLGCRFVRHMHNPVIPRVAGRYVDVLSVNAYSLVPRQAEFDAWHEAAERPIQIGEHQFALRDPRGLPTPWMALTAAERRVAVRDYSMAAARLPYCVGAHWFQFQDQPGTGRPSNGENMLIGLVDITDQPYPHMVDAFREIAEKCYAWHGAQRAQQA